MLGAAIKKNTTKGDIMRTLALVLPSFDHRAFSLTLEINSKKAGSNIAKMSRAAPGMGSGTIVTDSDVKSALKRGVNIEKASGNKL